MKFRRTKKHHKVMNKKTTSWVVGKNRMKMAGGEEGTLPRMDIRNLKTLTYILPYSSIGSPNWVTKRLICQKIDAIYNDMATSGGFG